MNGYVAFYRNKRMDVYAESSSAAHNQAALAFKARKTYDVTVVLSEKEGTPVTHTATE